ncbi:MAG TPA: PLP-dependent aminotransferase family protein [Vicinamibacteria bacterium]|nr:PLP-dependent aminotransferase family protein [Vicinamibacteria bacterium]
MLVRLSGDSPLHLQIYQAFREAILEGRLAPGARLPSSRGEARSLGVSRNVVLQAYAQLVAEGYLTGSVGSGTYVATELPEVTLGGPAHRSRSDGQSSSKVRLSAYGARAANASTFSSRKRVRYDFAYGVSRPDDTTLRQWQRALRKAGERPSLDYGPPEGESSLREAIAAHLFKNRGVRCSASEVVVTSGSQQALSLISRMFFEPGDAVVVEEPSYQGARHLFESDGLRVLAHPVDQDGLDIGTSGPDARACYVTPSHQFPTGVTMPLARRLRILAWAEARDAVVIEDDYDSEYRYEGRPLEAIQRLDSHGRVIYVGTFSKVLFPAVRLGFVVLPPSLVATFIKTKWLADRHSPRLEQRALAELIASGTFEQHQRRARARNASRRAALMEALASELGGAVELSGANAGIHLLAWLTSVPLSGLDQIVEKALAEGVGLYPVSPYYTSTPPRAGLLFGYGNLEEGDIREGIRRFARVLRSLV